MIVQIGLPILLLAALVVAYLSAKTWGWGHVVLGLALFFATLGFLILGAETLRIHAVLKKQVEESQEKIGQLEMQDRALVHGTEETGLVNQLMATELTLPEDAQSLDGINELRHQMNLVTRVRGRVWRDVRPNPQASTPQSIKVQVTSPDPHGIDQDTILYAFQEGPAPTAQQPGGSYLGEFKVQVVAGQEVTLVPVINWLPTDPEVVRLGQALATPWVLYETMPVDRHEIFAGMTEEELRAILPPQSVEDYIRQGTEATADDDEWHRIGYDVDGNRLGPENWDQAVTFKYERQLRDYAFLFHDLAQRRAELQADIASTKQDTERLTAALESAKKLQQYREQEKRKLQHDRDGMKGDLAAIQKLQAQVEQQLNNAKQALASLLAANKQLVAELTALQQAMAGRENLAAQ